MLVFGRSCGGEVLSLAELKVVEPALSVKLLALNALAWVVLHDFDLSGHRKIEVKDTVGVVGVQNEFAITYANAADHAVVSVEEIRGHPVNVLLGPLVKSLV